MPQRGRQGGKRTGRPGAQYPNRTDMQQAPRAVPGQPYGQAGAQLASQKQMPLPAQPAVGANPVGQVAGQQPGPLPGQLGPLTAPTDRPQEPLTAGLAQGAGPGPEALGAQSGPDDTLVAQLRGLYAAYPNSDTRKLLDAAEAKVRSPQLPPPPSSVPMMG